MNSPEQIKKKIATKLRRTPKIRKTVKGRIYVDNQLLPESEESFSNYLARREDVRYRKLNADWESLWK